MSVPVPQIEGTILRYCKGLNPGDLLPGREAAETKIRMLQGQLSAIRGKLENLNEQADNLIDSIAGTQSKEIRQRLETRLQTVLDEQSALEGQYIATQREFELASRAGQDTKEHLENLAQLFDALGGLQGQELIDLKLRLRQEIQRLIERILIYPEGDPRMTELDKKALLQMCEPNPETPDHKNFEAELDYKITHAKDELKILIEFKSGIIRVIYPRRGIRESMEMDEDFGTAMTQAIYKQGGGGEFFEYDEEEQQILAEHYRVDFPKAAKTT